MTTHSVIASLDKSGRSNLFTLFQNVVQGFSLVLHDLEGSHYKIWK